jgi:hypothetical protein
LKVALGQIGCWASSTARHTAGVAEKLQHIAFFFSSTSTILLANGCSEDLYARYDSFVVTLSEFAIKTIV